MANEIRIGKLGDLTLSFVPSAIIGAIGLWVVLSVIAIGSFRLSSVMGIAAALIATVLHFIGDTLHQLGHARAARRSGYPMIGIRYWFVLSTSLYPADEPSIPASVHIRRALGGPTVSLIVSALLLSRLRCYGPGAGHCGCWLSFLSWITSASSQ